MKLNWKLCLSYNKQNRLLLKLVIAILLMGLAFRFFVVRSKEFSSSDLETPLVDETEIAEAEAKPPVVSTVDVSEYEDENQMMAARNNASSTLVAVDDVPEPEDQNQMMPNKNESAIIGVDVPEPEDQDQKPLNESAIVHFVFPQPEDRNEMPEKDFGPEKCDLFTGDWVPNPSEPVYNNVSCAFMDSHQNCMKNGRPDSDYLYWSWKPRNCEVPPFDPEKFLDMMRNKTMALIGHSISRNHVESLLCTLSTLLKFTMTRNRDEARDAKKIKVLKSWVGSCKSGHIPHCWLSYCAQVAIGLIKDHNELVRVEAMKLLHRIIKFKQRQTTDGTESEFRECLIGTLPTIFHLLASAKANEVLGAIKLCEDIRVYAGVESRHTILPLVFANNVSTKVKDTLAGNIIVAGNPDATANNLIDFVKDSFIRSQDGCKTIVKAVVMRSGDEFSKVVTSLCKYTYDGIGTTDKKVFAFYVMCLVSGSEDFPHIKRIIEIGFGSPGEKDPNLIWVACVALQKLTGSEVSLLVKNQSMDFGGVITNILRDTEFVTQEDIWFSLAHEAIRAVYKQLHEPQTIVSGLLENLFKSLFDGSGDNISYILKSSEVVMLRRFFFLLGTVAMNEWAYVNMKQKSSALPKAKEPGAMEATKHIVLSEINFIAQYVPFLEEMCWNSKIFEYPALRASAMLTLSRLMMIDPKFCEKQLERFLCALMDTKDDIVHLSCTIHLSDLASSFPNLFEKKSCLIGKLLKCWGGESVRKNLLLVALHLISIKDMKDVWDTELLIQMATQV